MSKESAWEIRWQIWPGSAYTPQSLMKCINSPRISGEGFGSRRLNQQPSAVSLLAWLLPQESWDISKAVWLTDQFAALSFMKKRTKRKKKSRKLHLKFQPSWITNPPKSNIINGWSLITNNLEKLWMKTAVFTFLRKIWMDRQLRSKRSAITIKLHLINRILAVTMMKLTSALMRRRIKNWLT